MSSGAMILSLTNDLRKRKLKIISESRGSSLYAFSKAQMDLPISPFLK